MCARGIFTTSSEMQAIVKVNRKTPCANGPYNYLAQLQFKQYCNYSTNCITIYKIDINKLL